MIPRMGSVIWLVLIAVAAFGLYMVKYRVQALQQEIAGVQDELNQERENLHVVAAEWAYLTRPERLQRLAEKHTLLAPVEGRQVGQLSNLPFPSAAVVPSQTGVTPVNHVEGQ